MTLSKRPLSRRRMLTGGLAAAGLLALAAVPVHAAEGIIFWQYKDPPGSAGFQYFEEAAKRFEAESGIPVQVEFKSAEGIEQAVAAAANAGEGFDALVWWSGPTARNQASLGNVIPLDDKLPQEVWQNRMGLESTLYDDKHYAMPFDVSPWFLVYNLWTPPAARMV